MLRLSDWSAISRRALERNKEQTLLVSPIDSNFDLKEINSLGKTYNLKIPSSGTFDTLDGAIGRADKALSGIITRLGSPLAGPLKDLLNSFSEAAEESSKFQNISFVLWFIKLL